MIMPEKKYDLVAIGNAMVDILAFVTDDKLSFLSASKGITKGGMNLVDSTTASDIYQYMTQPIETSGGSAGNTVAGFTSFGGASAYIGKVADDQFGKIFKHDLLSLGVAFNTPPLQNAKPTGQAMIFVTPDGERTMCTYLGAGTLLNENDINEETIKQAKVLFLEGYLYDEEDAKKAFIKAAKIAEKNGVKVALTLSDANCVKRHLKDFISLVKNHVDIVFANEKEIKALYQTDDYSYAIDQARQDCKVAVLTRGSKGAFIVSGQALSKIDPVKVDNVLDTTGAGDQFAAGFLYGYLNGYGLEASGKLAAKAAGKIIQQLGPRPLKPFSDLLTRNQTKRPTLSP
jgi:fructokinase